MNNALFQFDPSGPDMQQQFAAMAEKLLHHMLVKAGDTTYRLAEIEFYVFVQGQEPFEDEETHRHPRQLLNHVWYVHRKSPQRTGIDLTFGNSEKNIYGGILIRAIQNTQDANEYVYGTSNVVKTLLYDRGLTRDQVESVPANRNVFLSLVENPEPFSDEIFACPRHLEGNVKKKFTDAPFRFFVLPEKKHVMKEKVIIPYLIGTLGREKVMKAFPGSVLPK